MRVTGLRFFAVFLLSILTANCSLIAGEDSPGQTRVARWQDDKKAALLLMFDDSMPSHVKNAIPELKKRGFVGTFYVNPGKGEWAAFRNAWEKEIPAAGMEYGNHTFTHGGILNMEHGDEEVGRCNEAIYKAFPQRKNPRLMSFGVPGVAKGKWMLSKEQLKELLDKHQLLERPKVGDRFAGMSLKNAAEMLKVVDKAIETGGLDSVAFHGVGGEWLSVTLQIFMEFMDGLTERREKLWITDHISAHKYETERDGAEVKIVVSRADMIQLALSSKADPKIYDQPLTLVIRVPAAWTKVRASQGERSVSVTPNQGVVRFDAIPGAEKISLSPE